MGKLGWFKFYPGDWMKDPELRAVSPGARGLWIDMLCLMFECDRRGYLQFNNGTIVTAEHLARMTGASTDDTSHWLQELFTSGVFSRTDDGTIFSRRMLRDEEERSRIRIAVTKSRCNKDVTVDVTASSVSVSGVDFDVGSKKKRQKFNFPALGEVIAYCQERGNLVDPQQWFNHYTANGWRVGRNPMKDWRAAVRTWEKNGHGTNRQVAQTRQPSAQVARWHNNRAERERARAAVVGSARDAGDGQEARLGSGNTHVLDGEVEGIRRR